MGVNLEVGLHDDIAFQAQVEVGLLETEVLEYFIHADVCLVILYLHHSDELEGPKIRYQFLRP